MGITPAALRLLIRECYKRGINGSVLTFGNQDIWASEKDILRMIKEEGMEPKLGQDMVKKHTSNYFNSLSHGDSRFQEFIHAESFFKMIGFDEYYDIDLFLQDKSKIIHDLNKPLPEELHNKFSLVCDFGTTEHIFNVPNVLYSVVKLLKDNGMVIHSPANFKYPIQEVC